jgi:hypothetical protein
MAQLAFIDGGGPVAAPSSKPQTHVVTSGETVPQIADRYGVTPQAIRDANPRIFQDHSPRRLDNADQTGQMIWSGDELNIPAAAESVTRDDPLSSDFNPTYPSSNSEYTVGGEGEHAGGSVTWNPGDGTVKATTVAQGGASYDASPEPPFGIPDPNARGLEFEAKVRAESAVTQGAVNKDGNTEVSVEVETNVQETVSAESKAKGGATVEGEYGTGAGFRARYKVALPGENRDPADAARVNPFDPTTIPQGATVTMDGQDYTQTSMAGSFRHIGFETNLKEASGASFSVTRVDDTHVSVTMGPNQAVEGYLGVGVRSDIATAMLGRQDSLGGSTVRTATFDLSNPDGQAAYAHFTATGEVADQTPGVSDVATIERIDYSSQTRVKLGLGPEALNVQADLAGPQNAGAFVKTTYPDGSYAYTTNLQYSGNVPLQVTQRFDASGTEVLSERTYEFKVDAGDDEAFFINQAWSGEFRGAGPATKGTVTLTFTQAQLQDLMADTRTTIRAGAGPDGRVTSASTDLQVLVGGFNGIPEKDPLEFAINMVRSLDGQPSRFSEMLSRVSAGADRRIGRDEGALPIEMTVRNG